MNESDLQRVFNYPIYPHDSKKNSDKIFINIDNGSMVGCHWTAVYVKINKSVVSVAILINFYLVNYVNQKNIIFIELKIFILNFVVTIVYTFSV